MTAMLFGLSPADPLTYGIAATVLTGVCVAATSVPARRASRIDPMVALKVGVERVILLTSIAAAILIALACVGFYLSRNVPGRPQIAALIVTPAASLSIAIIFAVTLNHAWGAKRDRDQRNFVARGQHLQRLQALLRTESEALSGIAGALRDGRYFTQVANDARQAIWHDDVLTTDVERHFPEYFQEREHLIRAILEHDRETGRVDKDLSASLRLADSTEPYISTS